MCLIVTMNFWVYMLDLPWDKPPEFVNENGVKWWQDKKTTCYAQKKNRDGKKLDVVCWFVEEPNGRRTRILVSKKGEVLEENQSLEAMLCKIDVLKFLV
jgi:hypothetical protein